MCEFFGRLFVLFYMAAILGMIMALLNGCTDPNAGKFPANGGQVIDGMRPAVFGPVVLP